MDFGPRSVADAFGLPRREPDGALSESALSCGAEERVVSGGILVGGGARVRRKAEEDKTVGKGVVGGARALGGRRGRRAAVVGAR